MKEREFLVYKIGACILMEEYRYSTKHGPYKKKKTKAIKEEEAFKKKSASVGAILNYECSK